MPFARRLDCPLVKSWRDDQRGTVAELMCDVVDAVREGQLARWDLLVGREAKEVQAHLGEVPILHTRSLPGSDLVARVQRALGLYTDRSMLSVVLLPRASRELLGTLDGQVIWEGDLWAYPHDERAPEAVPDPGLNPDAFLDAVDWSFSQTAGAPDWLLTCQDEVRLEAMVARAVSVIEGRGLPVQVFSGRHLR
jgi:hypothetical protein